MRTLLFLYLFALSLISTAQSQTITEPIQGRRSVLDSLAFLFNNQLAIFPQEKIYLHTDKSFYISGEKIWFRAYVADAVTHIPISFSRYVYVELIDPHDDVVTRIKIREEDGAYYGHLNTPGDSFEGAYTLRAYTAFMCSQAEEYLFTKTIHIGNPIHATLPPRPTIPASDFDVTFYPEGGHLFFDAIGKVAFKALTSDGQSVEVSGMVLDQSGNRVAEFKSDHLGMGIFLLCPEKGKSYYAFCENDKGQSESFALPLAVDQGYALSVGVSNDRIAVSVNRPLGATQNDTLYLLVHTRGTIHLIEPWDQNRVFSKGQFPSGLLHLILFDSRLNLMSERLVFIHNPDQAQVAYYADKEHFERRSLVKSSVRITDLEGRPISGSFSVAVTSSAASPDTASNILTHLLLSSDLRGYVEHPASYFQQTTQSDAALDLVMRTQWWQRYNVAEMMQGRLSRPTSPIEFGGEISGSVKNTLTGRAIEDAEVTAVSLSETQSFFNTARTGKDGRFYLPIKELPDSTRFLVSVNPQRGITRMELILDSEDFPVRTLSAIPTPHIKRDRFAQYTEIATQQFMNEEGIRISQLEAAVVSAQRQPPRTSQYYTKPDNSITEEQIEKTIFQNVFQLLARLPGVRVMQSQEDENKMIVVIRGIGTLFNTAYRNDREPGVVPRDPPLPLLIVDDVPTEFSYLNMLNVNEIAQIDLLKSPSNTAIFGVQGGNGVIVIHTKRGGSINKNNSESLYAKVISPLGYQQSIEFYAPKYDTPEKIGAFSRDLRTTIHWQPVVQTDSLGVASFEFYTADEQTPYTVIIEGLSDNGAIIQYIEKLWQ